uniref:Uncharacterized protein n=1 Tax=Helianthus annuus TaxID=4232 RepID=A0A251T5Y7_HELAN
MVIIGSDPDSNTRPLSVVKGSRCSQQYTQYGCNSECGKDCPCLNNSPAVKSIGYCTHNFVLTTISLAKCLTKPSIYIPIKIQKVPWLLLLKKRRRCLICGLETVLGYWRNMGQVGQCNLLCIVVVCL